MRPRIRRNPFGDEWLCFDPGWIAFGWGSTREAAYELWLHRFVRAQLR